MIARRGPGLLGTMARTAVVAGTAHAVVGGMDRRQQRLAEEQAQAEAYQYQQQQAQTQAQMQQYAQQASPQGGGPSPDMIAKLKELADLKAAGVLSEAEFAAAKAHLLGM